MNQEFPPFECYGFIINHTPANGYQPDKQFF